MDEALEMSCAKDTKERMADGIVVSGLVVIVTAWCVRLRGPLYALVFSLLSLVIVAIFASLMLDENLYVGRVGGVLVVSHAFGDRLLKQYVVADPEIQVGAEENKKYLYFLGFYFVYPLVADFVRGHMYIAKDKVNVGFDFETWKAGITGVLEDVRIEIMSKTDSSSSSFQRVGPSQLARTSESRIDSGAFAFTSATKRLVSLRRNRRLIFSRSRFWGTPLPLWISEDEEEVVVIDSVAKIEELSGDRMIPVDGRQDFSWILEVKGDRLDKLIQL
ncbi:hypothetical protein JHK85_023317 [Glycine max]|nr:hypothetical protein JHK85_023317 [Glycine max]